MLLRTLFFLKLTAEMDDLHLDICETLREKNDFTELSKNLNIYRSENNFVEPTK